MFVVQKKTVGKLVFFVSNMNVMALFYDIESLIFFYFFIAVFEENVWKIWLHDINLWGLCRILSIGQLGITNQNLFRPHKGVRGEGIPDELSW